VNGMPEVRRVPVSYIELVQSYLAQVDTDRLDEDSEDDLMTAYRELEDMRRGRGDADG